jgi:hypothetical protein
LHVAEAAYKEWNTLLEGVQKENERDKDTPSLPSTLSCLLIEEHELFRGLHVSIMDLTKLELYYSMTHLAVV